MMARLYPLFVIVALLTACAPITKHATFTEAQIKQEALYQQRLAIEQELAQRQRLATVMFRLEQAAAPECKGGKSISGLELGGIGLFDKSYHPAAQSLGFGKGARVMSVAPGSPADKADIKAGDTLVAINGKTVDESKTAYRKADRALAEAMQSGTANLTMRRAGSTYATALLPVAGCPTRIHITRETMPSPKANGEAVLIPYSLLRLSRTDDELATLAAFAFVFNVHELLSIPGEDELSIVKNRDISVLMGKDESSLFTLQRGIITRRELQQADEFAMTLMRRAGYDTRAAISFWRRLLVSTPELENDRLWGRSLLGAGRLVDMQLHAGSAK